MQIIQSLAAISWPACHWPAAAGVLGARSIARRRGAAGDDHVRLRRDPGICVAPWYIAEDLLRAEGFTDIRYVPVQSGLPTCR